MNDLQDSLALIFKGYYLEMLVLLKAIQLLIILHNYIKRIVVKLIWLVLQYAEMQQQFVIIDMLKMLKSTVYSDFVVGNYE